MTELPSSERSTNQMCQEEAEEQLLEAVEHIHAVQEEYGLDEEQNEFLKDAKSSIAAVHSSLGGRVVFDL